MATDTARVQLELASGRNESTAPFHQTAQRRHKQLETDAASVGAPEPTRVAIDVPLARSTQVDEAPAAPREFDGEQHPRLPGTARPPWTAFIAALIAVAFAVWWVMSQRLPDIDPGEVIARNLNDAEAAMAEGRYTDPAERSAFHYYNTVLSLDPDNADALAGIDAIADRHLTNARLLLSQRKIAEAGVALEKARRVRPEHKALAALDQQWRAELRTIIAASTEIAKPTTKPTTEAPPRSTVAKLREVIQRSLGADEPKAEQRAAAVIPKIESSPAAKATGSAPDVKNETFTQPVAQTPVTDSAPVTAALAANEPLPQPVADTPEPQAVSPPSSVTSIVEETVVAAAASPAEPKLIKMVQPAYPQEALMRGLEGWVDVSLQVSPAGDVIDPRVEESSRGRMFNRAALSAVQQWKYEPRGDGASSERVRVRLQFKHSN